MVGVWRSTVAVGGVASTVHVRVSVGAVPSAGSLTVAVTVCVPGVSVNRLRSRSRVSPGFATGLPSRVQAMLNNFLVGWLGSAKITPFDTTGFVVGVDEVNDGVVGTSADTAVVVTFHVRVAVRAAALRIAGSRT